MAGANIRVLQTVEHRCGYFADRRTRNLVVDPGADHLDIVYDTLTSSGFRRAGSLIFRPHCRGCEACQATRIPVVEFKPSRSQKRVLARNQDLSISRSPARFNPEVFDLYRRYLAARHSGGGMDNPAREDFENFLLSSWSRTFFIEFRLGDELLAVAVTDRLSSGLSAVYTFYDPEASRRSLGSFAILSQVEMARELRVPYLFLGYWINGHPKMHYKLDYQPIEIFDTGQWKRYPL
ncbi:MAG: arginyltransferase [Xanthomonadales bacterium]|nr:arginyltransferase [Xanthomonadales bacterium]